MGATRTLRLEGDLTIQSAADWHLALLSAANELGDEPEAGLALDLAQVVALDSAGVQLLLSARRSLAARGQWLRLVADNAGVADVLNTLGLQDLRPGAADAVEAAQSEGVPA